jgi:TetR/AcrR family transcriptional regulator
MSERRASDKAAAQASRNRLIQSAKREFAGKGLMGARVDEIARRAKANKQLIYYHFGDKDGLYLAALEDAYADIRRRERELNLGDLDPVTAMQRLVGFSFDYVVEHREFVQLLINENIQKAKYLRRAGSAKLERSPLVDMVAQTLRRGAEARVFRKGLDPVQVYVTISGMCFFYVSNIHTLSVLFERDLKSDAALAERRAHVIDFALAAMLSKDEPRKVKGGRVGMKRT